MTTSTADRPQRAKRALKAHQTPIREAVKQLGISPRAIRFYEEKGLIATTRDESNGRLLNSREMKRLKFLLNAKLCGFGLAEIQVAIERANSNGKLGFLPDEISRQKDHLIRQAKNVAAQREALERVFHSG